MSLMENRWNKKKDKNATIKLNKWLKRQIWFNIWTGVHVGSNNGTICETNQCSHTVCTVEHKTQSAARHMGSAGSLSCTAPAWRRALVEVRHVRAVGHVRHGSFWWHACAVEISCVSVLQEHGRWPTFPRPLTQHGRYYSGLFRIGPAPEAHRERLSTY